MTFLKGLGGTSKKELPGTDDITCKQRYKRQKKQTNKQTEKKIRFPKSNGPKRAI